MKLARFEEIIKNIAHIYFIALRNIRETKMMSSGEVDEYSPFYKYYADVEYAYSTLDKENRLIITKEYFYDGYKGWWINQYKASEFKKKKKIAVKQFVEAFYEIH